MIRSILCLLLCVLCLPPAHAADAVVGMSERVFKGINDAQAAIDAKDYEGARQILEGMRDKRASPYETAHILNVLGFSWYEQEQVGKARALYEEALALPNLPDSMQINLLRTLGQVCLIQEDNKAGEKWLRKLMEFPDQDTPANKVLLAIALMRQERYQEALPPLQQAVEARSGEGDTPPENWLSMLSSVYYELKDYTAMRDVVERLVRLYPREQYLMNLAALHGELGDREKQLALVEALLDEGRLHQESHLRMMASLFLSEDLPYKAAVLLQKEIDAGRVTASVSNLEQLSQAWQAAAEPEKAIPPLARAAKLSDDGELYLRLAQLHMNAYQWEAADQAARQAQSKGGLRREGVAWLVRGMAEVRLNQLTEARDKFRRAAAYDETAKHAGQWLAYVDSELEKQASLEAGS